MPSVHDIVKIINVSLQGMIDCDFADEKVQLNGIATSMIRNTPTTAEIIPATVDKYGEGEYVGIDDEWAVRGYHKANLITCNHTPGTGRTRDHKNSYSMSLVIFLNRKRSGFVPDEIVQLIQAWFPESIKLEPYSSINIAFNNVILNDLQVYGMEYRTDTYKLGPEHNLFLINYTVEATFRKGCFNNCKEHQVYPYT